MASVEEDRLLWLVLKLIVISSIVALLFVWFWKTFLDCKFFQKESDRKVLLHISQLFSGIFGFTAILSTFFRKITNVI